MCKFTNFIVSAVLSGIMLAAGNASAHSNPDGHWGHFNDHKGKHGHWHKKRRHHHRHDSQLAAPGSSPYALHAGSDQVDVTFTVELILGEKVTAPEFVYLRQQDDGKGRGHHYGSHDRSPVYKLNDAGINGDMLADDGFYSGTIRLDPDSHGDDCRVFGAFAGVGKHKIKSPDYSLCTTSFPVGSAPSDTRPENLVVLGENASPAVANELLVRVRSNVSDGQIRALARRVGAQVVGSVLPLNLYQFRFPQSLSLAQLNTHIRTLKRSGGVEHAYPNRIGTPTSLPNDPEYLATNQHGYEWINADDAWDIGADGSGITIALLDSGGVETHPDLPIGGGADPGNHGTPMAGIAAALTDNDIGIAAPAGNSTLLSFVLPSISWIDMIDRLEDINPTPAKVVIAGFNYTMAPSNIDFGEALTDQWDLCLAINNVVTGAGGAIMVSPAGNDSGNGWHYPSRCNDSVAPAHGGLTAANKSRLITVMGSVTCNSSCTPDTRQVDSNFGPWADAAAPSQNLRSTNNAGSYSNFSGTSFAASLVGGVVAQMLSCNAGLNDIEPRLISTAPVTVPYPASVVSGISYPAGNKPRIDAYAAVLAGNTSPTGLALGGGASINEGTDTGLGHSVGTLSVTDANACDRHTYSIEGGADAASFSIGGPGMDELILTAGVLDFETQSSYSVTVRVTDAGGQTFDQAFAVSVNDLPEPSFTIYSVRADYLAALGGATVLTQDFNSFTHNANLAGVSIVPGITVGSNMPNIIAWDPFNSGEVELFALDRASVGDAYYDILVTGTYNAIGFDIDAFNPATPGPGVMQVFFLDGTNTSVNIFPTNATEQDPVFFGVISNQPITSIRWNEGPEIGGGDGNEETTLDDFAVANLP